MPHRRKRPTGTQAGRPPAGVRPALEALEDRTLPDSSPAGAVLDVQGVGVRGDSYDPSVVLVRFRPGSAPEAGLAGASVGGPVALVPGLYEVRLSPGVSVAQALAAYRADPRVLTAEPDYRLGVSWTPNDPSFPQQWGLRNTGQSGGTPGADVHAAGAWNVTTGTRRTVVAVMDSGIDYTHPDLYQNVWLNDAEIPPSRRANLRDVDGDRVITFRDLNDPVNRGPFKITDLNGNGYIDAGDVLKPMAKDSSGRDTGAGGWADGVSEDGDTAHKDDLVGWNFSSNTNNPFDDFGHGTHVAGTIGAMGNNGVGVAGVDWRVQLMPVKFFNASGWGTIDQFIAGLSYAVAHGARLSNNSWTVAGFSQSLYDALASARARGHVAVCAAGNNTNNDDTTPVYPASFGLDNIVSVAATDRNDHLASFSNYGAKNVDLAAPGVDVLSTLPGKAYGLRSGTSMATPYVTGVLALVWGLRPEWGYRQVIAQVLSTTDPLSSLAGKVATGGRLDASAAVRVPPRSPTGPASVASAAVAPGGTSGVVAPASAASVAEAGAPAVAGADVVRALGEGRGLGDEAPPVHPAAPPDMKGSVPQLVRPPEHVVDAVFAAPEVLARVRSASLPDSRAWEDALALALADGREEQES
jgi:subtilisin family serine protease